MPPEPDEHAEGLDRAFVEKHDFPLRRRGYDPGAVAAHLAALAERVDALRGSDAPPRRGSLAGAASDQVRLILEAAERSAAGLEREAEAERDRILEEARREGTEHLERVARSAAAMLEHADVLESEFGALLDGVRASATRLTHELRALEEAVEELRPRAEPVREAPGAPVAPASPPPGDEGARLIALNMALSGTSREETERYLADQFDAVELDALLDDVYVRAGQ